MALAQLSKKLDPWSELYNRIQGIEHLRTVEGQVLRAEEIYEKMGRYIDEVLAMGGSFRSRWKKLRSVMPLQLRLVAEQIFYDRGGELRELISGFKPLDDVPAGGDDLPAARASTAKRVAATTPAGTPEWLKRKRNAIAQKQIGRR